MSDIDPTRSRYESLQAARRSLMGLAPLIPFGLLVAGLALFLKEDGRLVAGITPTSGQKLATGIIAFIGLGGLTLAGWVLGRLVQVGTEVLGLLVDQAEAAARTAELIEQHVVPALERAAASLERPIVATPIEDPRTKAIAGVRQAIAARNWGLAEALAQSFARAYSDDAEAPILAGEVAEERQAGIDDLRARLNASQEANDPTRVIELRDELARHLRGEPIKEINASVLKWLMNLIQRRLRTGTVRPDVAVLAAKVAETFGDTAEGAGLRASLPTLRRSAGLCPRCAQPYAGIEDACPQCLADVPTLSVMPAPELSADEEEEKEEDELANPFVE